MSPHQPHVGVADTGGVFPPAPEHDGTLWSDVVDVSRTPSPTPAAKRRKVRGDIAQDFGQQEVLGFLNANTGTQFSPGLLFGSQYGATSSLATSFPSDGTVARFAQRPTMQTGCIRCLIKGIPCNPNNPDCRLAMSGDWSLNRDPAGEDDIYGAQDSSSLTLFRLDTQWRRRNWRERHSLHFFVNFSAPQMAGFFDSSFWQRMVIQSSYYEPAILHAITAIGALHECIMQRGFTDEKRKARAIEFALGQCNRAISCLTNSRSPMAEVDVAGLNGKISNSNVALITCVLFTCFEAMQGRSDSAVNHALQGRRLLQATGWSGDPAMAPSVADDVEQMRPIVERLEVQATALLDKGRRPGVDFAERTPPLYPLEIIHSLDHAHNTLHTALNSVMRFMQHFSPTSSPEQKAAVMAEKSFRYGPWFAKWEEVFTTYLSETNETLSNMDMKRAMVLKTNHLVGTMLASVDQSAGPSGYDVFENEFRAIVDLAREVLASFSCPPLPTLTGGSSGTPYLSFSLWVTDPLWMAISRCRDPSIRQAAFTLLSQNPRQEGIWHAGPQYVNNKPSKSHHASKDNEKSAASESAQSGPTTSRSISESTHGQSVSSDVEIDRKSGERGRSGIK